jgi:hypothetical protein
MWTVSGPSSMTPLSGDGIEASVTGGQFCPAPQAPAEESD